ncbi:restriction endonuclease [Ideonella sp.]|uniref:restriction endonuclease n=1 Tax=Ideonella sp. TaxID=1929293 RepID=UPI0035AD8093
METRIGQLNVAYSARGKASFSLELWHDGLKKHRLIKGDDQQIVIRKAELQVAEWAERWQALAARDNDRSQKLQGKQHQESQKALALEKSAEAQAELAALSTLLQATLDVDDAIDWETLKDKTPFAEAKPQLRTKPVQPQRRQIPHEPEPGGLRYQPRLSLLDKLFSSRRALRNAEMKAKFDREHAEWAQTRETADREHAAAMRAFNEALDRQKAALAIEVQEWEQRRSTYLEQQALAHKAVDEQRAAYLSKNADAVIAYCDLVLSNSRYPDYFPQEFDLDFDPASGNLIVDYVLPSPDDMPTLKSVKYVATRDEFEEQHVTEAQLSRTYDEALYQVALRTIHELYEADAAGALQSIVFNGIVTSIDRGKGKQVTACVLSLRAGREEFAAIDLAKVDPKACFKSLKGVGSSKLHGLSPVPPIMPLRRDDARFVAGYAVASTLTEGDNLAAMDWEDFEHLIREVFEQEFSANGGEVKVTQASRDGGVDAVAFDPDPIRGGKIVIQAKRYTNTVGVSAVRDLYGTVLNEGATKGVLVTTSDFGPDSYAFANGKPLVLLSGANLLHMLERHGHKARIDIHEAKRMAPRS